MRLIAAGVAALFAAGPGAAATRAFTLTDFDRIRLAGPYEVVVRVGPAVSVRAEGSPDALDRARLEVQGGTLSIRVDRTQGAQAPGAAPDRMRIAIAMPALRGVAIVGSGSVTADRAIAPMVALSVAGAGTLRVDAIATDRVTMLLAGPGGATLGGRAAIASIVLQGTGRIDAAALAATDADIALTGAGSVTLAAARTAKVAASGGGDVAVVPAGATPPACTVRNDGTGEVRCGGPR